MKYLKLVKRDWQLLMIMLVPFAYLIIFKYAPMYGLIIAFKDFSLAKGYWGSPWVGMKWFIQFANSMYFWRLIRNTLLLNLYGVLFSFPIPIMFAMFLNEIRSKRIRSGIQTISYMPHFLSTVVVVSMLSTMLSTSGGLVNNIIIRLGGETIPFMTSKEWFRFLYIGSGIWQNFGFSSIVYMAAITGIPLEMYEAATIEGASRFQKLCYITFPSILPTIMIMLILRMGSLLSVGYEKVLLMYSTQTYETADVISTYVYRRGIQDADYSFSAAVGLFNSVINFIFIITFNSIAKKLNQATLW